MGVLGRGAAALTGLGLALMASAWAQPAPTAYDFKGIMLGISLEEMRVLPGPDQRAGPVALRCTGDPEVTGGVFSQTDVSEIEAQVGIRRCVYYDLSRPWPSHSLSLGGQSYIHNSVRHQFDFHADAVGVERLYRIILIGQADGLARALEALEQKFGLPDEAAEDEVETRLGGRRTQQILIWRNRVSSLTLEHPRPRLDEFRLEYRWTELADRVSAELAARRAAIPNRM